MGCKVKEVAAERVSCICRVECARNMVRYSPRRHARSKGCVGEGGGAIRTRHLDQEMEENGIVCWVHVHVDIEKVGLSCECECEIIGSQGRPGGPSSGASAAGGGSMGLGRLLRASGSTPIRKA